jgi:DNA-binding NarL/FixJ family response regulator
VVERFPQHVRCPVAGLSGKLHYVQSSGLSGRYRRFRVLVVADHTELQDAFVDLFGEEPDVELAGIARTASGALDQARCLRPDLLLVDIDMAGGIGERVIAEIVAELPETKLIAMSIRGDRQMLQHVRVLGAHKYLAKGADVVDSMRSFFQ